MQFSKPESLVSDGILLLLLLLLLLFCGLLPANLNDEIVRPRAPRDVLPGNRVAPPDRNIADAWKHPAR